MLFKLYGAYDCIDFKYPICIQENYGQTTEAVCNFVVERCYNASCLQQECKEWLINLFKNYKENPYRMENVGLGHFNLNLTTILEKFIYKAKIEPQKLDADFFKIITIVIEDWQPQLEKARRNQATNEMLSNWYKATAALHNALYN